MDSHSAIVDAYRARVHDGAWQPDDTQQRAAEMLQLLSNRLASYVPARRRHWAERLGFRRASDERVRQGLYLYGGVGRGKSALMDLFFSAAPIARKRRVHFHAFMLEVHARIHGYRQRIKAGDIKGDPIPPTAVDIATDAVLLCFDEFQVHDPADAMILSRLFTEMFERGVVVVATSNRAPDELYLGGLNRELFLPFIDLLKSQVDILELAGERDYRLDRLRSMTRYFSPLGPGADAALGEAFDRLTDGKPPAEHVIEVQGRQIVVPRSAAGVARFSFDELCRRPLGVADYIEIARQFHTLILSGIPRMGPEHRNEAKRLVNLVDVLYEHRVNLVCSADGAPDTLYPGGDGSFEFARAESRLAEMQADDYLGQEHMA
jgi:cell division protein ZapE